MPAEHLVHCLGYRKHSISGRKCYGYDIIMLLSSGSIFQALNYKSFLGKVNKHSQATVRASNSWSGRRVSKDEVMRDESQDTLAMTGSLLFIQSAKS